MIYLIGGAPRIGKSIVAKEIAAKINAPLLATDDLSKDMMDSLSEDKRQKKFPFPGFSGNPEENVLPSQRLIELQLVSALPLKPIINDMVANAIKNNESLVVEGIHILPQNMMDLISMYGKEKIRVLFVGLTDMGGVVSGIINNTNPNNWLRNSNSTVIRQVAAFAVAFAEWIKKEAHINGFPYYERTADFDIDKRKIAEQLLS